MMVDVVWNYGLNFNLNFVLLISAQINKTIKPKKIDFSRFWCTDSPSGDMQKSQIFLLYDAYFGIYGGLKFGPLGVPPNL